MKIYNMCGRQNSCCPEILHDEENDVYTLFDEQLGWSSGEVTFEQLIQIKEIIIKIENEREDIKNIK